MMVRNILRALPRLATLMLWGISAAAQAPRAARALPRGATLTASDIVAGACSARCVEPGWVTRKVITAGEALVAPAVGAPPVIIAGDSVDVTNRIGTAAIAVRGIAQSAAARDETLMVLLPHGARISCIAVAAGQVRLP